MGVGAAASLRTPAVTRGTSRGTEPAKIFCLWKLAQEDCVDYLKLNWTSEKGTGAGAGVGNRENSPSVCGNKARVFQTEGPDPLVVCKINATGCDQHFLSKE